MPIRSLYCCPQFSSGFLEPNIRAMFFNQIGGFAHNRRGENWVALRIVKGRERHAPGALARNAPIGPAFDRRFDSTLPPVRDPFDTVDFLQRSLAEGTVIGRIPLIWMSLPMCDLHGALVHG